MKEILSITDEAVLQIKKIISNAPKGTDGVIVGVDKTGCSGYAYKLDFAKNDQVQGFDLINKDGVKVYVDPKATMYLMGSEMDYQKDRLSSRFIFKNPNEKSTCGCGESFSI